MSLKIFRNSPGISLENFVGRAVAILGVRGSGKTNTAAVIAEELLALNIPVYVLDIDGEYVSLGESFPVIHLSFDVEGDINIRDWGYESAFQLAHILIEKELPVVIDLSGVLLNDVWDTVKGLLEGIWSIERELRKPVFIFLEEAHEFIPQGKTTEVKDSLVRMALRGRKRGIGLVMISQRSAKVDKDVLTQAEFYFLHKVVHPADIRVYKEILPLDSRIIEDSVPRLNRGEVFFYDGNTVERRYVRVRNTFHSGYTPSPGKTNVKRVINKEIIEKILREIKINVDFKQYLNVNRKKTIRTTSSSNKFQSTLNTNMFPYNSHNIVEIVNITRTLLKYSPSMRAHLYALLRAKKWIDYKELRRVSGFITINSREIKKAEMDGLISVRKIGRKKELLFIYSGLPEDILEIIFRTLLEIKGRK